MEWYESIGLESHPFKNDVLHSSVELVEREGELKRLTYLVRSGNLVSLQSASGLGKTSLLKAVVETFKGFGRVVYIDCANKDVNVANLIKNRSVKMILLLDNMDVVSRANTERIRYFFDEDLVQSIVFTSSQPLRASQALLSRIGANVITLPMISSSGSYQLLIQRLNGLTMISDKIAKKLHAMAHSISELLFFANVVCKNAVESGRQIVEQQDVDFLCKELQTSELSIIQKYDDVNVKYDDVSVKKKTKWRK